jgi:hypothetical protein
VSLHGVCGTARRSNAKQLWAKGQPMNCEELLVEQVQMTTSASPGTTVWVYRNR